MSTASPINLGLQLKALVDRLDKLPGAKPFADPTDWWQVKAALHDAVLTVLDMIDDYPETHPAYRSLAAALREKHRVQLHTAAWQYHLAAAADHAAARDPNTPQYRLLRRDTAHQILDELVGTFPTLSAAMLRAGHPDPSDWTTHLNNIDLNACVPSYPHWRIRAPRVTIDHLNLLPADHLVAHGRPQDAGS